MLLSLLIHFLYCVCHPTIGDVSNMFYICMLHKWTTFATGSCLSHICLKGLAGREGYNTSQAA